MYHFKESVFLQIIEKKELLILTKNLSYYYTLAYQKKNHFITNHCRELILILILKQKAHGPHRSPEKTVQINKHI